MFQINPEWRTSTVCAVAAEIRREWNCSAVPLLADALADAGCDNAMLLSFLRGEDPTIREEQFPIYRNGEVIKSVRRVKISQAGFYVRKSSKEFRILIESLSNYTHPDCPDELCDPIIRAIWDGTWAYEPKDSYNRNRLSRRVSMQYVPGEPVAPSGLQARLKVTRYYFVTSYDLSMPAFRLMRPDGKIISCSQIESLDPVAIEIKRIKDERRRTDWEHRYINPSTPADMRELQP